MAAAGAPRSDDYDVVVIGAGLGGLSAAASLARGGKHVLVVDRGDGPGGYAHAFRRGPYIFDPAVHFTAQANDGEFLDQYLRLLGVRELVSFVPVHPLYAVHVAGERFDAPVGVEAFISAHAQRFPNEAEGIARFVQLAVKVTRESQQLSQRLSLAELDQAARQFPALFRYRTLRTQNVLDEYLREPRLKSLLAALWPYFGVPPSALPFVQYAAYLVGMVATGSSYCRGSFQTLADAFAAALERNGGELLLNARVEQIQLEGGRVTGVRLGDGRQLRTSTVVSNADARQTFEVLVGVEHLPPRFVRRLRSMKPSPSAFVLYTATTLDMRASGLAHETLVYKQWDHDETHRDVLRNQPGGTWISVPTLHDPSLAPPGEHLVIFSSLAPYDVGMPWDEARERWTELMLDELERVLPGVRDRRTFTEVATPLTFERYTLNQRGAIYGWDHILSQCTPKRLPQLTPVPGLYLAGHWTDPGGSSFRCMFSGFVAAALLLGHRNPYALLEVLAGGAR